MSSVNSKQIAKNTIFLYIRMLLLLAVSLYTSRVILKVLGIDDYGIYNLIAGFVMFLAFISNALVSAMQRYFNVALGKKDFQNYKDVFSMSINILLGLSCLILILGESIGLWFVMTRLNIPSDRFEAAIWVYQISLFTFVANTLRTPFHASIIAHEKMSFYAYVSLFEVFVRLGMVFLLMIIQGDHLIMYALLYLVVIVLVNTIYMLYCRNNFQECRYSLKKDKALFKDLIGFSGWTLLGQASVVVKNQGEAIFINKFFTVATNAAMGVAAQVANALEMFVSNFQTAFNPQLIQSHASKDYIAHRDLLFRASKFSYFLLLIMLVPIVSNIDFILNLWLAEVPEYTNYFIVFILISYLFNALSTPFVTSIFATGNIKGYQIALTVIFVCGLITTFSVLQMGAKPYSVSIVSVFIQFALLLCRLYYAHNHVGVSFRRFISDVGVPISLVTILSIIPPCFLYSWQDNVLKVIFAIGMEICYIGLLIFFKKKKKSERKYIINTLKNKLV